MLLASLDIHAQVTRLQIAGQRTVYSQPYLVDFNFSLRDQNNHAIILPPSQFQVTCKENGTAIGSETGYRLISGDNKQLRCFLVLDYTYSMADPIANGDTNNNDYSDALETMEANAKALIGALHADAKVGIYEFHREDPAHPPRRVSALTDDKADLTNQIDHIWQDYVQGFPASTRCWDAVYAALGEFPDANPADDQRFLVFLSDGRDESSTSTPAEIISRANSKRVTIYCVGYGIDLVEANLQNIASQTGGKYYPATSLGQMSQQFEQIVLDLGGQYVLRWATLKRAPTEFTPSFELRLAGLVATATGPSYYPPSYDADVLQGRLFFDTSTNANGSCSLFLDALYMPRSITRLRLNYGAASPFSVSLVSPSEGGLCPTNWAMTRTEGPDGGTIELRSDKPQSISSALPFASVGKLLRFQFPAVPDPTACFYGLNVETTNYIAGQSFLIVNSNAVTSPINQHGRLIVEATTNNIGQTVVKLLTQSTPLGITGIRLILSTPYSMSASIVPPSQGGLCPTNWTLSRIDYPGYSTLELTGPKPPSAYAALPYGSNGNLLEIVVGTTDPRGAFSDFSIDNTLYSGGQSFALVGVSSVWWRLPPLTPSNPSPRNGATKVLGPAVLDWADTPWAQSYQMRLWTNTLSSKPSFSYIPLAGTAGTGARTEVRDINKDGHADILVTSWELGWFENDRQKPPQFTWHTIKSLEDAIPVFAVDMDQDGWDDLITGVTDGNVVFTLYKKGQSTPEYEEKRVEVGSPTWVFPADVDGDGWADLIVGANGTEIVWFRNQHDRTFGSLQRVGALDRPARICAADFDQDGRVDIVATSYSASQVVVYRNLGRQPVAFEAMTVDAAANGVACLAVGDLDQDGRVDIVAGHGTGNELCWYLNNGNTPAQFTKRIIESRAVPYSVEVADLDNDGDLDVLATFWAGAEVRWYENITGAGIPQFIGHSVGGADGLRHASAGDLDGDGDVDLVMLNGWREGGSVGWFSNDAAPASINPLLSTSVAGSNVKLPQALLPNQVYYWQVTASNSYGSARGPVWSFQTSSQAASISNFLFWVQIMDLPEGRRGIEDRNGPLNLPNLLAFGMGLDPLTAKSEDLPYATLRRSEGGDKLVVTYRRSTTAQGVGLQLASAAGLVGKPWSPVVVNPVKLGPSADGKAQLWQAEFPIDASMRFIRAEATQLP